MNVRQFIYIFVFSACNGGLDCEKLRRVQLERLQIHERYCKRLKCTVLSLCVVQNLVGRQ